MTPNWHGDEPVLMGVVNVTPDSFSDGGQFFDIDAAIAHGLRLRDEGAAILDIGGESTRPGAAPVSVAEEIRRVVPVIEGLRDCGAMLSVDTRQAAVMEAALAAGAKLLNDVSALTHDPRSLSVAADSGASVCLMHMKGDPRTMQDAPYYDDVVTDVYDYLSARIEVCLAAGVTQDKIMVDPGIGFGKTLEHNLLLLKNLDRFAELGVPMLLGVSRKRFIASLYKGVPADERLAGSLATCLAAYDKGVRMFRVHDVAETAQALSVYRVVR